MTIVQEVLAQAFLSFNPILLHHRFEYYTLTSLSWAGSKRKGWMMRILYVASEAVPFAKTGGLADVVGSLPKSIKELGHEAVVVIPRYRGIRVKEPPLSSLTVPLGGVWRFCSI